MTEEKCLKCKKEIKEKNKGKSSEEIEFEKWSDKKQCKLAVQENSDSLKYVRDYKIFMKLLKLKKDSD